MRKQQVKKILIEEMVSHLVEQRIAEVWNALQTWLAQHGDDKYSLIKDEQEKQNSCRRAERAAYQEGLRAALTFIEEYERARKAKQ